MAIIYLIESVRDYDTAYKIGYTKSNNSKKNRIKNLQTGNDGKLKIISEFNTKHGKLLETTIHNYFKSKKIINEWFDLDIKDVTNFVNICEKLENNLDQLENNYFIQKLKNKLK